MSINSTVNSLLSQINSSTGDNGVNLSKSELKSLFEDTNYYNAGETGQKAIQKQIEELEKIIESLQKDAEALQEEIDEANLSVDDSAEELSNIVSKINAGTTEYQGNIKDAAKQATYDAITAYKQNNGSADFEECFSQALDKRMSGISGISMSTLKALYAQYDTVKDSISPVLSEINTLLQGVSLLETKLNNTNATINLLTTTKNNMSDTIKGAYKNVDTDTKVPVYSGAKAELADELLGTYLSRYEATDETAAANTAGVSANAQAAMEKWLDQKEGTYKSGDKYNVATNPELANLRSLYEAGMLDELQASGMSTDEILTFISENWDVGIYKNDNGNWSIPNGHSADAWCKEGVYSALADMIKSSTTAKTADDVDQNQMAELKKAVEEDGILTQMYNAGYSYKEAMYLLTKLFPNAGITYNLSDQDGTKTYSRVSDTDASGSLYSTISSQILEYWNVGGELEKTGDTSTTGKVNKYDPITFQSGNTTYTFITDRDNDGTFDYTNGSDNELLGSANGIQELIDYDYNGDGKIDASDFTTDADGNKVYALDQLTLMANNQIENYNGTTNSVDFDVTYTSARLAGITSIDLSSLLTDNTEGTGDSLSDSSKTYDNVQENYEDINGSSVINSFNITMKDGSTVTANETLNTEDNLETFYKQIADNNTNAIYSSIDENEFEDAFTSWATDAAETTGDIIDSMKDTLEELKAQAEAAGEGSGYELNMDWSDLTELYGTDGKSGTYIDMVKERAANAASPYKNDNSNENKGIAANAVGDALDELNESDDVKVQITGGNECEPEEDIEPDMGD